MNIRKLSLAALAVALPLAASAATPGEHMEQRIDTRQAIQERRIDAGVANGALTARETVRLERQQGRIDRAEDRALSDGALNRAEARQLNRMQNRASRNIARQKHDRQSRP